MGKKAKLAAKLQKKATKKVSKTAKLEEGLVLKDAENQVYRIPFSKLEKFKISGSDAAKQLKKAKGLGAGSPEVMSGCVDRPCVNFTDGSR